MLFCSSSLCNVVFLSRLVLFRLSYQFRFSADPTNDFSVANVANLETRVFQRLEYSHIHRLMYFVFYVVNIDVVSLLADSSFLFLANLY